MLEAEHVERVEAELDQFIEKRARESKDANQLEELWAVTEREVREKRRREHRDQWLGFHDHMRALHSSLAAEHARKAAALQLEDPGGGVIPNR